MPYSRLYFLVEGDDDVRFFESIVIPLISHKYDYISVQPCACFAPRKLRSFINSIKSMNAEYVYVADLDRSPCLANKKNIILKRRLIDKDKVLIVVKEIEGWYLAGVSNPVSKAMRFVVPQDTNGLTKEQFDQLIPSRFSSRIAFMIELLQHFSIEIGRKKNKSLDYFCKGKPLGALV